jgi:predicted transcriptional regulator
MVPPNETVTPCHTVLRVILGPLETQVMEILWNGGERSVREVVNSLNREVAYTTVMTTLERLFKKGLAFRKKCSRAYLYWSRVTCQEWKDGMARDVVAKLLAGPQGSREALITCLLEAVAQQDALLLREIQKKMRDT